MATFSIWHWIILCVVALLWGYLIYRLVRSVRQQRHVSMADQPSNVVRFEQVMYLSVGVILIRSAFQVQNVSNQAGVISLAIAVAIMSALTILFAWLISRRRVNWARWVFLIFFLLTIPGYAVILSRGFQTNPGVSILSVVQLSLYGFAAYLIFTGNAVSWFRKLHGEVSSVNVRTESSMKV